MKTLHITTTGRKSGKKRTTPLYYFEHEGKYVITASAGGKAKHPDWFLNLRAAPNVDVRVGKQSYSATARPAAAALRKKLWVKLIAQAASRRRPSASFRWCY